MQPIEFITDTLAHFVRGDDGPPPGIPAHVAPEFEQELTWLCEWHSVTAIVLSSLQKLALRPGMSRLAWARMKALAETGATLSRELVAAARSLAADLDRAGIRNLLVQDVAYALTLYPLPELRPVESIEILVDERDWDGVIDSCARAGFTCRDNVHAFRDGAEALAYYQRFSPCLLHNPNGDRLRLRFRLFEPGSPDPAEACWRRGGPLGEGGPAGLALEDQLIASCVTHNVSRFGRLLDAVDIGLIVARRGDGIDWGYVGERMRSRAVYAAGVLTMRHAVEVMRLPPSLVRLKSPGIVRKHLFFFLWPGMEEEFSSGSQRRQHRLRYCLLEMDGWPEKVRFMTRLFSPRRQWVEAFFGKPYSPWLKLRFVVLALRDRLGAT
ncbi:MAG: nucleotidyltransferase family protein [Candidatus Krumholzibacteriia bacterium]